MKKHIVFDLDWTLVDTQKIHQKIEADFLSSKWIHINPLEVWKQYAGRSPSEWLPEVLHEHKVSFTQEEIVNFVESKDEKVIDLLKKWEIVLMPFVQEVLQVLSQGWCKIWISSGACREFIDNFVSYFGLSEVIEASTSANEVKNKKPAPDVFINSFDILKRKYWEPEGKYVVWDWKSDIIGWNLSWAKTILYNNSNIDTEQIIEILNFEIKNFNELPSLVL